MKLWAIAAAFLFTGFACAEEAIKLPNINTTDDLQQFLEKGVICENEWAANTLFAQKPDAAALKRLDSMVKKLGFATGLSITQEYQSMTIRPREPEEKIKGIKIYGFDVERVHIDANDDAGFDAVLYADKEAVLSKLNALGLNKHPFKRLLGDESESYFDNKKIAHHAEAIRVYDVCEGDKTCQTETPSVRLGCIGYGSEGDRERMSDE
jgi:hypothetical protein